MDSTARAEHALLGPLRSEEEAIAWIEALVEQCEETRLQIDAAVMVQSQRKLFCRWMILRGQAHGALSALKRCGRVSDTCHNQLRERILRTEHPTIIAQAMPFSEVAR